ncbi:MAG: PAS domain-containing protein, partial [Deltaproteobacteria bacterium]|nr:PAS domain-containing protein [Deltaproteobacteria bacterium]
IAAFVALRSGDPRRALAASRRAHSRPFDPSAEGRASAVALRAEALLLSGDVGEAEALAQSALACRAPAEAEWLELILAEARLAVGDVSGGEAHLRGVGPGSGLLSARADMLRARGLLGDQTRIDAARAALSLAVWKLVRLGAPRELGVAYLSMSDVEVASGADRRVAADWLARAQPLLARAGTPQDLQRLRAAFRSFGRRAVDRVVDAEAGGRIDAMRHARSALRDLATTLHDELLTRGRAVESVPEVEEVAAGLRDATEELVSDLERALVDRERVGQLIQAGRRLMPLERSQDVIEAIPALALSLGVGDTAEVVERSEQGELRVIASQGPASARARARSEPELFKVLEGGDARLFQRASSASEAPGARPEPSRERVAVLPVRNDRRELCLVVGVSASAGVIRQADLERLRLFVSLAASSLERARGAEALHLAASRDAATIEAIRDGVLTLDDAGFISSLNRTGARLLGITAEALVGRALVDTPSVAALGRLLDRGRDLDDEIVSLPRQDLLVRLRLHPGGCVLSFTERARAEHRAQRLVGSDAHFDFSDIVGEDAGLRRALEDARRAAQVDVPILITGESGTGKEVLAQAIHNASPRARSPFVGVNVAAIPRELLESELFGYEPGAFTGARPGGHPGKFELAQDGTLLLDEIGEMSAELQAKLLRVLQERRVQRLGGSRATPIRARILATTHRDLEAAVEEGSFRLDLYYRLKVVQLELPPLRQRRGDVSLLIEHYLSRFAADSGQPRMRVTPEVMRRFEAYAWPGNVRELANMVEAEASLAPPGTEWLTSVPRALARRLERHSSAPPADALVPVTDAPVLTLAEVERRVFAHALASTKGNVAAAAKALGVSRATFYNKLRRYGLKRP